MAKKKRSAKQIAATKKLVALNKKRRKKKKTTRRKRVVRRKAAKKRKVARKRNPKRSAKAHLWNIFKCKGKSVYWCCLRVGKPAWTLTRGDALTWKVKGNAETNARYMAKRRGMASWQVGVANQNDTLAQIVAQCKRGK